MTLLRLMLQLAGVALLASSVAAQGTVTVEPDTHYSQRDTFVIVSIAADAGFTDVKAVQLDIDVDPTIIQADPAHVSMGSLWVDDPDSTFIYYTLSPDHSRLTIDIAVLGDGKTKDGPGSLASIRFNTVGFGISNIDISSYKLRDTLNQPMTATVVNSWVRVCRHVGDINGDNRIDLIDLARLIVYLLVPGAPAPSPMEAANTDCRGIVDLADLSYLVAYMVGVGRICKICL